MTLERRDEAWMDEALRDVRSGRQELWLARSAQITSLADSAAIAARSNRADDSGRSSPTATLACTSKWQNRYLPIVESGSQIKGITQRSAQDRRVYLEDGQARRPVLRRGQGQWCAGGDAGTACQRFIDWVDASTDHRRDGSRLAGRCPDSRRGHARREAVLAPHRSRAARQGACAWATRSRLTAMVQAKQSSRSRLEQPRRYPPLCRSS